MTALTRCIVTVGGIPESTNVHFSKEVWTKTSPSDTSSSPRVPIFIKRTGQNKIYHFLIIFYHFFNIFNQELPHNFTYIYPQIWEQTRIGKLSGNKHSIVQNSCPVEHFLLVTLKKMFLYSADERWRAQTRAIAKRARSRPLRSSLV